MDDQQLEIAALVSRMPFITYKTHRLATFEPRPGTEKAYQACLDFMDGKGHFLLSLFSEPGGGKTHLALGIGWCWLINCGRGVVYYQVEDLLDELRAGFNAKDKERQFQFDVRLNFLKKIPLLILDDLGAEQTTDWARSKLDLILDARYINKLRTVVTSNLKKSELPPRIASRLGEGVCVAITAGDYRKVKAGVK